MSPGVRRPIAPRRAFAPRKRRDRGFPAGCLAALAWPLAGCLGSEGDGPPPSDPVVIEVPGFPAPPLPESNPTTQAGVALGRRLFHDRILSNNQSQSCALCHRPQGGFSDPGNRVSRGSHGEDGLLNAPSLTNAAWSRAHFWNGRAATLEDQALEPVPNPIEMDLPWPEAVARLRDHDEYPDRFAAAFGSRAIDSLRVVRALAQFQRTLISADSKWDRVQRGEAEFTAEEARGELLFTTEKGDCFHCHAAPLFGDGVFRNNGLDANVSGTGRAVVTGVPGDAGKWKTPTLRNVEVTGPYMHDGRFATLEEVLDHYAEGVRLSPTVDDLMLLRLRRPPDSVLSADDKRDLIAFLRTLTDSTFLQNPAFGPP